MFRKTPEGMPTGSFGPTTAGRMDPYVMDFQSKGASMIMVAKGNRSQDVSQEIISNVCQALEEHEAVVVAIPSTDTVYEMKDGKVARIPNRATIMRAQTPQAFRLPLIAEAYAKALGVTDLRTAACATAHLPATDDCGIVHEHMPEVPIYIVEGEEQNKKITFKEDI